MKKIVLVFYTAVFFMFLVSVFLEDNIPKNTVVIGNEGFSTKYFNMESHKEEIEKKLEMNHGEYFLKNHFGKWYDGRNGKAVPEEWIPMITYKDELGEEYFYDEGDGAEISFDEKFMKEIRTKLRRDNNSFQNTYEYKGWIYYNKRDKEGNHGDNKIFRIKKDGMAETNLQASGYIYKIEDGWIYYGDFWRWTTKTNEISKMRIDGSDKSRVFDYESEEVFFENHRKNYSLKERKIYQIENNGERKELINLLEYAPGFNVFHNGNYVYATNWSDILFIDLEKDEHIIYEDKILAAIIEDYMYLVDWSEGEGILYRVKRGTKEKEVVSRGCDEFLAYKEGWIYFAHLKDCKDIHGRLDIYKCRIDGEEQERVAEEIRCENWDWSKNRIVFTTREDNKTYRYDLRNEAKEYIGIDIELTNQFDESMIFRSSRTDQYYILRNNETKLKKLHWGDIIIVTEKDGSIYYFDEPDYYSEDQEEASILSFYKYNLEKEREETIGKDIDCSLEEYLLIE